MALDIRTARPDVEPQVTEGVSTEQVVASPVEAAEELGRIEFPSISPGLGAAPSEETAAAGLQQQTQQQDANAPSRAASQPEQTSTLQAAAEPAGLQTQPEPSQELEAELSGLTVEARAEGPAPTPELEQERTVEPGPAEANELEPEEAPAQRSPMRFFSRFFSSSRKEEEIADDIFVPRPAEGNDPIGVPDTRSSQQAADEEARDKKASEVDDAQRSQAGNQAKGGRPAFVGNAPLFSSIISSKRDEVKKKVKEDANEGAAHNTVYGRMVSRGIDYDMEEISIGAELFADMLRSPECRLDEYLTSMNPAVWANVDFSYMRTDPERWIDDNWDLLISTDSIPAVVCKSPTSDASSGFRCFVTLHRGDSSIYMHYAVANVCTADFDGDECVVWFNADEYNLHQELWQYFIGIDKVQNLDDGFVYLGYLGNVDELLEYYFTNYQFPFLTDAERRRVAEAYYELTMLRARADAEGGGDFNADVRRFLKQVDDIVDSDPDAGVMILQTCIDGSGAMNRVRLAVASRGSTIDYKAFFAALESDEPVEAIFDEEMEKSVKKGKMAASVAQQLVDHNTAIPDYFADRVTENVLYRAIADQMNKVKANPDVRWTGDVWFDVETGEYHQTSEELYALNASAKRAFADAASSITAYYSLSVRHMMGNKTPLEWISAENKARKKRNDAKRKKAKKDGTEIKDLNLEPNATFADWASRFSQACNRCAHECNVATSVISTNGSMISVVRVPTIDLGLSNHMSNLANFVQIVYGDFTLGYLFGPVLGGNQVLAKRNLKDAFEDNDIELPIDLLTGFFSVKDAVQDAKDKAYGRKKEKYAKNPAGRFNKKLAKHKRKWYANIDRRLVADNPGENEKADDLDPLYRLLLSGLSQRTRRPTMMWNVFWGKDGEGGTFSELASALNDFVPRFFDLDGNLEEGDLRARQNSMANQALQLFIGLDELYHQVFEITGDDTLGSAIESNLMTAFVDAYQRNRSLTKHDVARIFIRDTVRVRSARLRRLAEDIRRVNDQINNLTDASEELVGDLSNELARLNRLFAEEDNALSQCSPVWAALTNDIRSGGALFQGTIAAIQNNNEFISELVPSHVRERLIRGTARTRESLGVRNAISGVNADADVDADVAFVWQPRGERIVTPQDIIARTAYAFIQNSDMPFDDIIAVLDAFSKVANREMGLRNMVTKVCGAKRASRKDEFPASMTFAGLFANPRSESANSGYLLDDGQASVLSYGRKARDAFSRYNRRDWRTAEDEFQEAARKYRDQPGALMRYVNRLGKYTVFLSRGVMADGIVASVDQVVRNKEKAQNSASTNADAKATAQAVNGRMTADFDIIASTSFGDVMARDMIENPMYIVNALLDPEFEYCGKFPGTGVYISRQTLLTPFLEELHPGISYLAATEREIEEAFWLFLSYFPNIASYFNILEAEAVFKRVNTTSGDAKVGTATSLVDAMDSVLDPYNFFNDDLSHAKAERVFANDPFFRALMTTTVDFSHKKPFRYRQDLMDNIFDAVDWLRQVAYICNSDEDVDARFFAERICDGFRQQVKSTVPQPNTVEDVRADDELRYRNAENGYLLTMAMIDEMEDHFVDLIEAMIDADANERDAGRPSILLDIVVDADVAVNAGLHLFNNFNETNVEAYRQTLQVSNAATTEVMTAVNGATSNDFVFLGGIGIEDEVDDCGGEDFVEVLLTDDFFDLHYSSMFIGWTTEGGVEVDPAFYQQLRDEAGDAGILKLHNPAFCKCPLCPCRKHATNRDMSRRTSSAIGRFFNFTRTYSTEDLLLQIKKVVNDELNRVIKREILEVLPPTGADILSLAASQPFYFETSPGNQLPPKSFSIGSVENTRMWVAFVMMRAAENMGFDAMTFAEYINVAQCLVRQRSNGEMYILNLREASEVANAAALNALVNPRCTGENVIESMKSALLVYPDVLPPGLPALQLNDVLHSIPPASKILRRPGSYNPYESNIELKLSVLSEIHRKLKFAKNLNSPLAASAKMSDSQSFKAPKRYREVDARSIDTAFSSKSNKLWQEGTRDEVAEPNALNAVLQENRSVTSQPWVQSNFKLWSGDKSPNHPYILCGVLRNEKSLFFVPDDKADFKPKGKRAISYSVGPTYAHIIYTGTNTDMDENIEAVERDLENCKAMGMTVFIVGTPPESCAGVSIGFDNESGLEIYRIDYLEVRCNETKNDASGNSYAQVAEFAMPNPQTQVYWAGNLYDPHPCNTANPLGWGDSMEYLTDYGAEDVAENSKYARDYPVKTDDLFGPFYNQDGYDGDHSDPANQDQSRNIRGLLDDPKTRVRFRLPRPANTNHSTLPVDEARLILSDFVDGDGRITRLGRQRYRSIDVCPGMDIDQKRELLRVWKQDDAWADFDLDRHRIVNARQNQIVAWVACEVIEADGGVHLCLNPLLGVDLDVKSGPSRFSVEDIYLERDTNRIITKIKREIDLDQEFIVGKSYSSLHSSQKSTLTDRLENDDGTQFEDTRLVDGSQIWSYSLWASIKNRSRGNTWLTNMYNITNFARRSEHGYNIAFDLPGAFPGVNRYDDPAVSDDAFRKVDDVGNVTDEFEFNALSELVFNLQAGTATPSMWRAARDASDNGIISIWPEGNETEKREMDFFLNAVVGQALAFGMNPSTFFCSYHSRLSPDMQQTDPRDIDQRQKALILLYKRMTKDSLDADKWAEKVSDADMQFMGLSPNEMQLRLRRGYAASIVANRFDAENKAAKVHSGISSEWNVLFKRSDLSSFYEDFFVMMNRMMPDLVPASPFGDIPEQGDHHHIIEFSRYLNGRAVIQAPLGNLGVYWMPFDCGNIRMGEEIENFLSNTVDSSDTYVQNLSAQANESSLRYLSTDQLRAMAGYARLGRNVFTGLYGPNTAIVTTLGRTEVIDRTLETTPVDEDEFLRSQMNEAMGR